MPVERAVTDHEGDPSHCPIDDLAVHRIHVNPQNVERDMLPPGKFVASRITHRRWTGGTALLTQRHGLLNEAEAEFEHIRLFRFATPFRATLFRHFL